MGLCGSKDEAHGSRTTSQVPNFTSEDTREAVDVARAAPPSTPPANRSQAVASDAHAAARAHDVEADTVFVTRVTVVRVEQLAEEA